MQSVSSAKANPKVHCTFWLTVLYPLKNRRRRARHLYRNAAIFPHETMITQSKEIDS
ncbi:predicted protein [Plenodomus lingam JN3]|uniref:Predicted protein n=1 Tax=Leptosphaeria maculans (strain JN3 / isolate v23.1.3 / race Av1-4-5-6-7-8) TaxID=985895 RepID=E4ZT73_LEPMJ|nr:predicted protein [Plenodomus lingam JN3]CBX94504.1 predicted protein [Plenodomus lingam JN3]